MEKILCYIAIYIRSSTKGFYMDLKFCKAEALLLVW